jgi:hypothetical protein
VLGARFPIKLQKVADRRSEINACEVRSTNREAESPEPRHQNTAHESELAAQRQKSPAAFRTFLSEQCVSDISGEVKTA